LTWTEVNSGLTSIAKYVVRFGVFESFAWYAVSDVKTGGCGAPVYGSTAGGGRTRSCIVGGLIPHRAYRFQLTAYTGTLNTNAVFGPLSNVAEATTAQRVGPMLVVRPTVTLGDTIVLQGAWISAYPDTFPLRGRWLTGDYALTGFGDSNRVIARGYLLVVKPNE
jgi:hypothetical protein